ncbi:MAG: hypothetical protein AAF490_00120 [Chloroflexota bacterium]
MFDWQTDEEPQEWFEQKPDRKSGTNRPRRGRWFLIGFVVFIAFGVVIYRQTIKRAEEAILNTKQEILAAHHLVMSAAQNGDVALFRGNLSGEDLAWVVVQETAVQNQTFFDRPFYGVGFTAVGNPKLATVADITLTNDFLTAQVAYRVPYWVEVGEGITETVSLTHTAVYRKGRTRWLYGPPRNSDWGAWLTYELPRLKLYAPEADSDIAGVYAVQFNQHLEQLCGEYQFDCPEDWRLEVRFSPDFPLDRAQIRLDAIEDSSHILQLPTPTLIGVPHTNAAKSAHQNSYASLIILHAIADLTGYDCCQKKNLFDLVVDKQLSELEIRPFTLTPEKYSQLFDKWDQDHFRIIWNNLKMTPQDRQFGLLELTFIQSQLNVSNGALARAISNQNENDPTFQLYRDVFFIDERTDLSSEMIQFVYQRSTYSNHNQTAAFPDQSILLSCIGSPGFVILGHHPSKEGWHQKSIYSLFEPAVSPYGYTMLGNNKFVINSIELDEDLDLDNLIFTQSLFLWDGESVQPLITGGEYENFNTPELLENENYLIVQKYSQDHNTPSETVLLDLNHCHEAGCQSRSIGEYKAYQLSPDRNRLFFYGGIENQFAQSLIAHDLYVTNEILHPAWMVANNVHAADWLGNDHLVYLQLIEDGQQLHWALMLYKVHSKGRTVLFSSQDNALPDINNVTNWFELDFASSFSEAPIVYVRAWPKGATLPRRGGIEFLFEVDLDNSKASIQILSERIEEEGTFLQLEGKWLTSGKVSTENGYFVTYQLRHLETMQTYQIDALDFAPSIWSDDKQWVVYRLNQNQLALLEPESGYRYLLPSHEGVCTSAGWEEDS